MAKRVMIIGTAAVAAEILAPLFAGASEERVAVLHLDDARRFLALTAEDPGTENEVELPIGAILAKALRVGASGIIVAHNHPSGDSNPSAADRGATRALADAARSVDLRLYDHLIFGGGSWRSFQALGLV